MQVGPFNWADKTVLVTGGSGFKGAYLVWLLLRLGALVCAVVRPRDDHESAFNLLGVADHRKFKAVRVDVTNRQEVVDLINRVRPGVVFHLAAVATVPVANEDPDRAFAVNVDGTRNLLTACRSRSFVKRILFCSTDHVFGPVSASMIPVPEHAPVSYGAPYDTSKACMELLVRSFYKTYPDDMPAGCITRCANAFGMGDTAQRRVLPRFFDGASRWPYRVPLTTRKNGRQFISVLDAVSGYVAAVSRLEQVQVPAGQAVPTFHFAIEQYDESVEPFIRIEALAKLVADLTGATVEEQPGCVDYMPNENPVQGLSCAWTASQLGWAPQKSFAQALDSLLEWYSPDTDHRRRVELIRAEAEDAARWLEGSPVGGLSRSIARLGIDRNTPANLKQEYSI